MEMAGEISYPGVVEFVSPLVGTNGSAHVDLRVKYGNGR